jgi:circadian clock protein KaiB
MGQEDSSRNALSYKLKLFIAGSQPNSQLMRRTVEGLCERYLASRYSLEVFDVLEDFRPALEHNVLVAPTLIIEEPPPPIRIVGCVRDPRRILAILGLGEVHP